MNNGFQVNDKVQFFTEFGYEIGHIVITNGPFADVKVDGQIKTIPIALLEVCPN